jgi:threonine/homoserine/homoserine lactone efflux protein
MNELLPSLPLLYAFLVASLVLAVTPGPGVFYIVTRSITEGRKSGLASVAGVALGNLGNSVGAAFGIAAVFSASATAFEVVRYAGALYLLLLGWKALRGRAVEPARRLAAPNRRRLVVRDGFLVALLNPKTALFFAAFLPQFVVTASAHPLQPAVLGALFVAIAASTDALYAIFASLAAPRFARARSSMRAARFATSGAYFGLGIFAALSGIRGER